MHNELGLALMWWLEAGPAKTHNRTTSTAFDAQALQKDTCEVRPWEKKSSPTGHLLCDARSQPPRVAAVLLIDKTVYYSDWVPSPEVPDSSAVLKGPTGTLACVEVMSCFKVRADKPIMSLELLSIAFGTAVAPQLPPHRLRADTACRNFVL